MSNSDEEYYSDDYDNIDYENEIRDWIEFLQNIQQNMINDVINFAVPLCEYLKTDDIEQFINEVKY